MALPVQPLPYFVDHQQTRYRRIGKVLAILAIAIGGTGALLNLISLLQSFIVGNGFYSPVIRQGGVVGWYLASNLAFGVVLNIMLAAAGTAFLLRAAIAWHIALAFVLAYAARYLSYAVFALIMRLGTSRLYTMFELFGMLSNFFFVAVVILIMFHPAVRALLQPLPRAATGHEQP